MSIKLKLFSITAVGLFVLATIGGVGYWGNQHLGSATADMGRNTSILRNHLTADMMHDALSSDVMTALVAGGRNDSDMLAEARAALEEHSRTFLEMLEANSELVRQDEIQVALNQVLPALNAYIESATNIVEQAGEDRAAALGALPGFRNSYEELAVRMESLTELIEARSASVSTTAQTVSARANQVIVIATLVGLLVLAGIAWSISTGITRALGELVDGARSVADGDLTQAMTVRGNDEIAQTADALETMRQNLSSMVASMNALASRLGEASDSLIAVSRETHHGMVEQESETAQAATAMQEMAATAQDVSQNITQAANAASQAHTSASEANTVVEASIGAMRNLAVQIQQTSNVINQLNSDSSEISQILDVITNLAEQTNLLALNAAIEAARAGEQGRGFAVVADEVRNLAARTQESTDQIKQTIEKVQTGSGTAVNSTQASESHSKEVVEKVRQAGESLASITASVDDINGMNSQIASAAEQQSAVADDISRSLEAIKDRTRTTTQSTERTSEAAGEVADISGELQKAVKRFQVSS